MNNIWNWN